MLILRTAAVLVMATTLSAATDTTYTSLRNARLDGRTVPLSKVSVKRDAYSLTLDGSLHLLQPVGGVTSAAVFTGSGEYLLAPAHAIEQRQLAINTGDDKLTVLTYTFDSAVIFDTALIKSL